MLYAALDSMPNPMDRERQLQQSKEPQKTPPEDPNHLKPPVPTSATNSHPQSPPISTINTATNDTSDTNYQEYVQRFDEQFLDYCNQELTKINSFFAEKLAEATRRFGDLKKELNSILPGIKRPNSPFTVLHRTPTNVSGTGSSGALGDRSRSRLADNEPQLSHRKSQKKIADLKLAFSEFYLNLVLLHNYQELNFTGFRKILKKHDKLLSTHRGTDWRLANVNGATFYISKDVKKLIEETEDVFTNVLEGGDRSKAMKRLRVPPLNAHQSLWTTFRVGLFSGAFLILLIVVLTACKY